MCPEHFKRLSHFFRSRIYESNNISELKNPLSQVKIKTNSMYQSKKVIAEAVKSTIK